jgi:hypothetical protein
MSLGSSEALSAAAAIPQLRFAVHGVEPLHPAVAPTLAFELASESGDQRPIRSVLLDVQVQIAARGRGYDREEQELLADLFGAPSRWGSTLRTVPWVRSTLIVPPFRGSTSVRLLVPCSYDVEVAASRYLAALNEGEVPLELLFSGTIFFSDADGLLQTARIALDCEVRHGLPVAAWRAAIDRHFPGSAWLRVERTRFERLCAYKARHSLTSWEAVVDALLARAAERGDD